MANGIEESWPWHSFRQQTKMPSLQIPTKNLANFSRKLRLVPHIPSPFDFFQQNTEIFLPLLVFFTVENHGSVFQKSRDSFFPMLSFQSHFHGEFSKNQKKMECMERSDGSGFIPQESSTNRDHLSS